MRAHPLPHHDRPDPPCDCPRTLPVILAVLIAAFLLAALAGCGATLYRIGSSFTDHTATVESVNSVQDTPTIVSTPDGRWKALGDGVEATGETWEEAAQRWELLQKEKGRKP